MGDSCGEVGFPQGLGADKPWSSRKKAGLSPPTIHMWITGGFPEGTDHLIRTFRTRP